MRRWPPHCRGGVPLPGAVIHTYHPEGCDDDVLMVPATETTSRSQRYKPNWLLRLVQQGGYAGARTPGCEPSYPSEEGLSPGAFSRLWLDHSCLICNQPYGTGSLWGISGRPVQTLRVGPAQPQLQSPFAPTREGPAMRQALSLVLKMEPVP